MNSISARWRTILICGLLMATTLMVFAPLFRSDFTRLDDQTYVIENSHVAGGLSWENVKWSLGAGHAGNWHPVTWWSHMLDAQLYGLKPGGHHLTSVLFHAVNALLLFLLLRRLTGAEWRSAMVATLFALHPLHVESVAWVSERKDVLSTFFFLLTLGAYVEYARSAKDSASRITHRGWLFYGLALACFSLGLMSKSMLVTLPFVLLLLDCWPLRRIQFGNPAFHPSMLRPLLWEKLPFLVLSIAVSIVTFLVQANWFSIAPVEALSLGARMANAIASYCKYLVKTFWPLDLAIFYPHPGFTGSGLQQWPVLQLVVAVLLLAGTSVAAVLAWKQKPWFATGWFWYLGMLVPVIGIVQVGRQALADRYSYLPLIGIYICLVWGMSDFFRRRRFGARVLSVLGWGTIVACVITTHKQVGYWRNNVALFEHALAVTSQNSLAHYVLAVELTSLGKTEEAVAQYQAGLRINPNDPSAHNNLGVMLLKLGRREEAMQHYVQALQLNPNYAEPHYNIGFLLVVNGQLDKAVGDFNAALRLKPDYADAMKGLGNVLLMQRKLPEAQEQFANLVRLYPANVEARVGLGEVLRRLDRPGEAFRHFGEAVRLKPDHAVARFNLGMILLEQGEYSEAESLLAEAVRLNSDDAEALAGLARAQSRQGKMREATTHFARAINLRPNSAELLAELAWLLATNPHDEFRNGPQAVSLAERACKLNGGRQAQNWATLDAAYAEVGRFSDAIKAAEKARELALAAGQSDLAEATVARIALYRDQKPFRQ